MKVEITTVSNICFNITDPSFDMIQGEDIAHALSHIPRANGHFHHFLSVARHCINCSLEAKARHLSTRIQLACLLHDASEAYMGDMTSPLKKHLVAYQVIENHLLETIMHKYDLVLTSNERADIKQIDKDMLNYEFRFFKDDLTLDISRIKSIPSLEFRGFESDAQQFLQMLNTLIGEV